MNLFEQQSRVSKLFNNAGLSATIDIVAAMDPKQSACTVLIMNETYQDHLLEPHAWFDGTLGTTMRP
jgi:hypothetical protein